MKIDQLPRIPVTPEQTRPVGSKKTVETTASQASTSVGRGVDAQLADSSQDIDPVRVAELREAIANGQLHIDTSRIADGLLASVQEWMKPGA